MLSPLPLENGWVAQLFPKETGAQPAACVPLSHRMKSLQGIWGPQGKEGYFSLAFLLPHLLAFSCQSSCLTHPEAPAGQDGGALQKLAVLGMSHDMGPRTSWNLVVHEGGDGNMEAQSKAVRDKGKLLNREEQALQISKWKSKCGLHLSKSPYFLHLRLQERAEMEAILYTSRFSIS